MLSSKQAGFGAVGQKSSTIKTDTVAGSTDATTFKDSAEGTIERADLTAKIS